MGTDRSNSPTGPSNSTAGPTSSPTYHPAAALNEPQEAKSEQRPDRSVSPVVNTTSETTGVHTASISLADLRAKEARERIRKFLNE
jgi:hypothetical protein